MCWLRMGLWVTPPSPQDNAHLPGAESLEEEEECEAPDH